MSSNSLIKSVPFALEQVAPSITISASTTSANAAIAMGGADILLVYSASFSAATYLRAGTSPQVATDADFAVGAVGRELWRVPSDTTDIAVLASAGSHVVSVTPVRLVNAV